MTHVVDAIAEQADLAFLKSLRPIDCDIHPQIVGMRQLLPFFRDHWGDYVIQRGLDDLESYNYPPKMPLTARPDWRPAEAKPASTLDRVQEDVLDPYNARFAVANFLFAVQLLFSEDMAAACCLALNDYVAANWLAKDPRLKASILVPSQNPELAVEEIERCAGNPGFVQVLMLVSNDLPLGRRHYWPIYAAAERHGLPMCFHAGSTFRHPLTSAGQASFYIEDYTSQSQAFQSQLVSLVMEGVFQEYPNLKVVLAESGVTWLPSLLVRMDKFWRGLRMETPWLEEAPTDVVRRNVRFTLQPFDAPKDAGLVQRIIDQLESDDLLLFSTDYPHHQFDGTDVLPAGLSRDLVRKIAVENPLATYRRLRELS